MTSQSNTNETRLSILVESSKKTQSRSNDVTSGLPPSVPRSQHHDDEPVVPKQYGLYDTDEQPTKLRKVAVGPRGPTYKGRCMSIESKPGCSQTLSCANNELCRVQSSRHLCSEYVNLFYHNASNLKVRTNQCFTDNKTWKQAHYRGASRFSKKKSGLYLSEKRQRRILPINTMNCNVTNY